MVVRRTKAAAKTDSGFLFPNAAGRNWGHSNWSAYFQSAVSRTKLEDFRNYDCRSTFALHLAQNGVNLRAVADLLGHSSLAMVMRYAYLAPSHLEAAIDTFSIPKISHSDTDTRNGAAERN